MRYLLITWLLLATGCSGKLTKTPHTIEFKAIAIEDEQQLVGKWSFSPHWSGHMGIALELKADNTFEYWFNSDFGTSPSPKYPFDGEWELSKGTLRLYPDEPDLHLYAEDWIWIEFEDHQGLFSVNNLSVLIWHETTPDTRMLYRNDNAPWWPMMNMPYPGQDLSGGSGLWGPVEEE